MKAGVGLLVSDVMPIYMIIALNIVITMRFSINCPIVICLPIVCYVFEREASSENYGPGSILNIKRKPKNLCYNLFTSLFFYNLYFYQYKI